MASLEQPVSPPTPTAGTPKGWTIAQTNLGLYRQLHDLGYTSERLAQIRAAYELATVLFAGRFRPCGRPFIAHLVGTASVLAALGAPPDVVAAGLLHAAYEQGDSGFTRWRNRRARVRRVVGAEVEQLIGRYDALKWNGRTIPAVLDQLGAFTQPDVLLVLMRLANEFDDRDDFARELAGGALPGDRMLHPIMVEIAMRLGKPNLAAALGIAFREPADQAWLASLRTDQR